MLESFMQILAITGLGLLVLIIADVIGRQIVLKLRSSKRSTKTWVRGDYANKGAKETKLEPKNFRQLETKKWKAQVL